MCAQHLETLNCDNFSIICLPSCCGLLMLQYYIKQMNETKFSIARWFLFQYLHSLSRLTVGQVEHSLKIMWQSLYYFLYDRNTVFALVWPAERGCL